MGGRCAEELEFNEMSNGASNDIERATSLAHSMVCSWGMSEKLGPRNFKNPGIGAFGAPGSESASYSEATGQQIDAAISEFILKNYNIAMKILRDNKDTLKRLSESLIVWETLDYAQIQDVVAGKDIGIPLYQPKSHKKDDLAKEDKQQEEEDKKEEEEKKDPTVKVESEEKEVIEASDSETNPA